jgi:OFA family oxalate/formate antiporter-like MFS transporter
MNKAIVVLSAVLVQLCLGGVYAWSAFVQPLRHEHGFSAAQTQLVFGAIIAVFTLTMVWAGRLLARWDPRGLTAMGGLLFGGGYWVASCSDGAFWPVLIGIGGGGGAGIGFGYVCALTLCIRWFPQRKGLATGIAVFAFGAGAILLSQLAETLLARPRPVLEVFRVVGVAYGLCVVLAALGLHAPPTSAQATTSKPTALRELGWDPFFWRLVAGMFAGTFAGLLVIGNLKPLGVEAGMSPALATLAITSLAVGNAVGRLLWGWISDRIGCRAIPLSLAVLAAALLAVLAVRHTGPGFVASVVLVGFGFGACFVLYAAQVAARYGATQFNHIYPWVFLAYGVAGVTGPPLGGWLFDLTHSYLTPIVLACLLLGGGAAATLRLQPRVSVAHRSFPP